MKKPVYCFLLCLLIMMFVSCSSTGTTITSRTEKLNETADLITDYEQLGDYLRETGYGKREPGHDHHFEYRGKEWSVNKTAANVLYDNTGNCGGGSNLFCSLLNGDYDEIGYLYRRDRNGGHVVNYFHDKDGTWHLVDVTGFVNGSDYGNHITGSSLQEIADEYVRRCNYGWSRNNTGLYIRSLYAIRCVNGESHPPVSTIPESEGVEMGYFPSNYRSQITELYVKDGASYNSMGFVDYEIPFSVYPAGCK